MIRNLREFIKAHVDFRTTNMWQNLAKSGAHKILKPQIVWHIPQIQNPQSSEMCYGLMSVCMKLWLEGIEWKYKAHETTNKR